MGYHSTLDYETGEGVMLSLVYNLTMKIGKKNNLPELSRDEFVAGMSRKMERAIWLHEKDINC